MSFLHFHVKENAKIFTKYKNEPKVNTLIISLPQTQELIFMKTANIEKTAECMEVLPPPSSSPSLNFFNKFKMITRMFRAIP